MSIAIHLERLEKIYLSMDQAFEGLAAFYGFDCQGCQDNCCHTYFYHYTIAEYLYLLQGLFALPGEKGEEVMERARVMGDPGKKEDYLCPLNQDGRCLLYSHRTMICRLHGLPFEFRRPDGRREEGSGCSKLEDERRIRGLPYRRIDRTPFYTDLACLERNIREEIGYSQKLKKTIAEMLRDRGEDLGIRVP